MLKGANNLQPDSRAVRAHGTMWQMLPAVSLGSNPDWPGPLLHVTVLMSSWDNAVNFQVICTILSSQSLYYFLPLQ